MLTSPGFHVTLMLTSPGPHVILIWQDLQDAAGCVMHELEPLERQLRAHLAHMGVLDPASQEAPPPTNTNSGRAMLPTQASQNRTSAIMAEHCAPNLPKGANGESEEGLDLAAIQRARRRSSNASPSASGIMPDDVSPTKSPGGLSVGAGATGLGFAGSAAKLAAAETLAEGAALEESILAADAEVRKLEAVRELLIELKAVEQPPRYRHGAAQ